MNLEHFIGAYKSYIVMFCTQVVTVSQRSQDTVWVSRQFVCCET